MQMSRLSTYCGMILSVLLLTGCDMTTPSQLETAQIRLGEEIKTVRIDPTQFDAATVDSIARDHSLNGRGPVAVVVPYRSGSPMDEMDAKRQGKIWVQALQRKGIKNVTADYVGVEDKRLLNTAVISYPALSALPPEGCRRLTGYNGADSLEDVHGYRIGCETNTAFSKMIVDPQDLMGRASGSGQSEARRQGGLVEGHMSGTPNERIQGGTASAIGGGG